MFQHFLHTLTLYFVGKSMLLRALYLMLFLTFYFFALSYFDFEEWIGAQYKQVDAATTQSEILRLFETYNMKSKCAKVFCTHNELQERGLLQHAAQQEMQNVAKQPIAQHTRHTYTLLFTCEGMACYEFLRALEVLPLVFVEKAASSNVTFLQEKATQEHASMLDSNTKERELEAQKSLEWRQDMYIVLLLEEYRNE